MIAKIMISIFIFVSMYPHIQTLRYRLIFGSLVVAGLSGFVGTATRLEPAGMIFVNFVYAAIVSVPVTIILHFATEAMLHARRGMRAGVR